MNRQYARKIGSPRHTPLPRGEMLTILALEEAGPITPAKLAVHIGMGPDRRMLEQGRAVPSSMHVMLRRLSEKGFAKASGRGFWVLTPDGDKLAGGWRQFLASVGSRVRRNMGW